MPLPSPRPGIGYDRSGAKPTDETQSRATLDGDSRGICNGRRETPGRSAMRAGTASQAASFASPNPLLEPWSGPHGGVPPFDRVRVADFKPALHAAMSE